MIQYDPQKDPDFWKFFFSVEDLSEEGELQELQHGKSSIAISVRNSVTGEKKTYSGLKLKKTIRSKS